MKKIDKTKKNIGVNELDPQTRKKLFNEFIEAGGEVIKEKEEEPDPGRDQTKRIKRANENLKTNSSKEHSANIKSAKTSRRDAELKSKDNIPKSYEPVKLNRFRLLFHRIDIQLRLFFMKVTDFSGIYFTPQFFKRMDEDYKAALLSVQMAYINLFKQNLRAGRQITDSLDNLHPIYYELIELLSNVFDRTNMNEIMEHYYNFPDILQDTSDLREQLTGIFIRLYPLHQYNELISDGFERAYGVLSRIEKNKQNKQITNKKKIKNDLYIIFNKLYPRLFWLMCHYEKRILLSSMDIENTISVPAEYSPGNRKKREPLTFEMSIEEQKRILNQEDIQGEESENRESHAVKKGFDLMRRINSVRDPEFFSRNSIFKSVKMKDKVYYAGLLFDDFDREFSFILTTSKIKYNTIIKSSDNMDYKTKFASIYNEIEKCKNRLRDYASTLAAYEKLKKDKPISSTQFIEYSNRLTALEKERNQEAFDARMYIKAFMEKLSTELAVLNDDMENAKKIIYNPEDILLFETEIEGNKLLNGRNVKEAVNYTYNYAMSLIHRLNHDGDLGGAPDFEAGEVNPLSIDSFDTKSAKEEHHREKEKSKKGHKSLIDELDDLI